MMYKKNIDAYKKVERVISSGRETEARVLTEGAIKLKHCQDNWEAENRHSLLMAALKYNQQIWSIFQTELAKADNPLAKDVRLNLLRLSAFVDKQIFLTMAYPSPEKLTPIININLGLASGLEKSPAKSSATTSAVTPG